MTPRKPAADYRGEWNHARFIAECNRNGITNGTELSKFMRDRLIVRGTPPDLCPSLRTWQRVWNGKTDPSTAGGSKGTRAMLLVIADFLGVNPAWLLSADKGSRDALIAKSKGGAP